MQVVVEPNAIADLDVLWEQDEDAAADIEVLLEALEECPDWLWRLTRPEGYRHYGDPQFDVVKFEELWRKKLNLFRIKPLLNPLTSGYRILYACDHRTDTLHVLAVVGKEADTYATSNPIIQRVVADYNRLQLFGTC